MAIDMVTVSSKGQVVLPASMRTALSIGDGDRLAVYETDGIIMMKPVKLPTERDFRKHLDEAKEWAASVGYQEDDVADIVKAVRRRQRP